MLQTWPVSTFSASFYPEQSNGFISSSLWVPSATLSGNLTSFTIILFYCNDPISMRRIPAGIPFKYQPIARRKIIMAIWKLPNVSVSYLDTAWRFRCQEHGRPQPTFLSLAETVNFLDQNYRHLPRLLLLMSNSSVLKQLSTRILNVLILSETLPNVPKYIYLYVFFCKINLILGGGAECSLHWWTVAQLIGLCLGRKKRCCPWPKIPCAVQWTKPWVFSSTRFASKCMRFVVFNIACFTWERWFESCVENFLVDLSFP